MSAIRRSPLRWAAAAALAAAGAAGILVLAQDDEANGGAGSAASAGRWSALQPSPLTRTEVGAARIDDFIYVVGGFEAPTGRTVAGVARYQIAADRWQVLDPMPIAVNHPAVAALGGRLFVHGGYRADGELAAETDALQSYDPATGAWATLSASGFPRAAHALAAAGDRLYAIGGAHRGGRPLRRVQVYVPAEDRWTGAPKLGVAREHLASAVIGRRIYALAGRARGRNLDVAERLDTGKGGWSPVEELRTPRSGFGAAVVDGRIIAVGGEELAEGDDTIASVEAYDPKRRRWRRLPSMVTPRHGLGVASQGGLVFAVEGGPQPGLAFSSALEVLRLP